ncbi:MAG: GGDEF domain-containing protein [Aristaeellaceae bacterium]
MLKKRKETSPNAGTPTEERRSVLGDLFLRGGISEKEYKEILPAIDKKNRETLLLASIMCAVMFTGLLVACLYSSTIKDAVAYYCTMAVACVCLAILSATTVKKHPRLALWLWYVLYAFFGGYAVLLNTIMRPDISATTLCAFLVAGPLLIIDRPIRVTVYMAGLSAVFIVLAHSCKTSYLAFADSVNVVCCIFIGITIYTRIVRIKLRDIIQTRLLEKERDTDKLTNLLNKAAIERNIQEKLLTPGVRGTLVMLDIDNFKQVNDTFGHAYGDVVLRFAAECIQQETSALCGRFGGDEFLLFLPETGEELAEKMERLLQRFKEYIQLPVAGSCLCVSAGTASVPDDETDYQRLFQMADKALYAAKRAGKNRWIAYAQEENVGSILPE